MCPLQLDLEEEIPTARICNECKGEGLMREETATQVKMRKCKWCDGKGTLPVSGQRAATRG